MSDELQRQSHALARDLARRTAALAERSPESIAVLDRLVLRLELGVDRYGRLDLAKPRDWRRELREELLDALIYDAVDVMRTERVRRAPLHDAAARELAGEWNDAPTVASEVPARLALDDMADNDEPYRVDLEFDGSDVVRGGA